MKHVNKWMIVPYKPPASMTVTTALSDALRKPNNPTEKIIAYNQVLNKTANVAHPVVPKIEDDNLYEEEKSEQELINTSVISEPFLNYTLHRNDSDSNQTIHEIDDDPMDVSMQQQPIYNARPIKPPLSVSKLNRRIQTKPKRKKREVSPSFSPKREKAITRAQRMLESEGYTVTKNYKEYETPNPHNKVKIIERNGWEKFK